MTTPLGDMETNLLSKLVEFYFYQSFGVKLEYLFIVSDLLTFLSSLNNREKLKLVVEWLKAIKAVHDSARNDCLGHES